MIRNVLIFIMLFMFGCQKEEFPKQVTIPSNINDNFTTSCTYKGNKDDFDFVFSKSNKIDINIGNHGNFVVSVLSQYKEIESLYVELLACDKGGNVLYGKSFNLPTPKDKDEYANSFFLTKDNGSEPDEIKEFNKLIKKLKLSKENFLLIRLKESKYKEIFDSYYTNINFE